MELKRTPLYEIHHQYGGRVIDFGGWALPVQYKGIIDEHRAVREKAGIFDVSHMGEILVEGGQALDLLQELVTNDVSKMKINQVQYTPMCNDRGGIIDDFIIYRLGESKYLLVVNAANTEKDLNRVLEVAKGYPEARVEDITDQVGIIAIQGPLAKEILQKITPQDLGDIKYFWCVQDVEAAGENTMLISRTGYTGEDGFEIYCPSQSAPAIWEALMKEGEGLGLVPAGLGCRDTLRFEVCLPLYGNELTEDTNPLEAGLGRFVKLDKPSFRGREAIAEMKEEGPGRVLVGLEMTSRGIARTNYPILENGQKVGVITSGSFAPSLDKNLALGYVPKELSEIGTALQVDARGRLIDARIVPIPFYKKEEN
ncbi:MAG: glycine cleavage system aminomethyltransferase GcvT [Clostridia bacterium]|nr:glycine cleavage system aminomethyltransferase GcvT [Clostridia bacterium]